MLNIMDTNVETCQILKGPENTKCLNYGKIMSSVSTEFLEENENLNSEIMRGSQTVIF